MKKRIIILVAAVVFFIISCFQGFKVFGGIISAKHSMSKTDTVIDDRMSSSKCELDPAKVYNSLTKMAGVQSIDTIFDLNLKSSKFDVLRELRGGDVSSLQGVHLLEIYITPKDIKTVLASLKKSNLLISSLYVDTSVVIRVYIKGR